MSEEKEFNRSTAQPLTGCVDAETAFVQPDYPYGRRLRCQRRVWVETNPRYGMRLMTQTTNPKRVGLRWNTPHAGTYSALMALWVDDKGFVSTDSLADAGYYTVEQLKAWGERNQALLQADEYVRTKLAIAIYNRETYEARKAADQVKHVHPKTTWVPGQGIVRTSETVTLQ